MALQAMHVRARAGAAVGVGTGASVGVGVDVGGGANTGSVSASHTFTTVVGSLLDLVSHEPPFALLVVGVVLTRPRRRLELDEGTHERIFNSPAPAVDGNE